MAGLFRNVVYGFPGATKRACRPVELVDLIEKGVQEEVHEGYSLVEGRLLCASGYLTPRCTRKDVLYLVVVLILGEELEVEREVLSDLPVLEVLRDQVLVDGNPFVPACPHHA